MIAYHLVLSEVSIEKSAPPATLVTELHYRHVNTTGRISITCANDKCGKLHTKLSIRPGLDPHRYELENESTSSDQTSFNSDLR